MLDALPRGLGPDLLLRRDDVQGGQRELEVRPEVLDQDVSLASSMCRCVTHLVDVDVGGAGHGDGGYGGVRCVHVECHHLSCEAVNILRKFEWWWK